MIIPPLFICPISLDLFTDPVTLSTGQTYERGSIEKWLATGNLTCPVTMQKLQDPSMVPNCTLRHLIDEWIQRGQQLGTHFFKRIDFDFEFSLATVRHNLESNETSLESKLQVLAKIQTLSKELPSNNHCLIQLGLFSLLLELVFGEIRGEGENLKFVEQALVCVTKLWPFSELGSLNMLQEEPKLARFELLFEQGNVMIKKSLCQLVEAISSSLYTKELCIVLGKNVSLLEGIVMLLHDNTDQASESGIKCISALCCLESNKENLVQAGAIQGLVTYILASEKREFFLAPIAMATLEALLGLKSGKNEIICCPKGVNALVKMVFRVSDHEGTSESALNSLMIVCYDSLSAREEAICAGVLTRLLLLLQSQCSEGTKAKARMLLKLLR